MKIRKTIAWIYYFNDISNLDEKKVGKWMYFFSDISFAKKICIETVENNIVSEAKHSNSSDGVVCFYLNIDDFDGHKRIINYFLNNSLIKRTKAGKYYNISFKLDLQTLAGQYGENFKSELKLDKFIDLNSRKWIE